MDNTSSIIPPPLSLNDCIVNGDLDHMRYYTYTCKRILQSQRRIALDEVVKVKRKWCVDILSLNEVHKRNKWTKRSVEKRDLWIRAYNGSLRAMLPTDTIWFKLYVEQPILSNHLRRVFRNRFRSPHASFFELLD